MGRALGSCLNLLCEALCERPRGVDYRTATHCNAMQHTATHCNALQPTASHCNAHCGRHQGVNSHNATHFNTLQYSATYCNTLQHTTTHCNTIQHTATQCNTLQHTATHIVGSVEEQILGLQIAVHNHKFVAVLHSRHNLLEKFARFLLG